MMPIKGPTPDKRLPQVRMEDVDPALREAAEGMEALFLDYLIQTMRKTVPKGEMSLESPAVGIYQGMLDSAVAEKSAHQGGMGLATQIVETMLSREYTGNRDPSGNAGKKPSTGGSP